MSGDIRKRLGRKANVHYQRGLQLPRRAKLRSLQSVYTVGGFFVLTFLFSTLFVRLTEGANVTAPDRAVSIVSTKDKLSASPPISIMNKINQKNVLKAPRSILGGIVSSIPPKPAWVSMPLYTDPTNSAAQYAATHPTATGASYITRMSQVPVAQWFGDWNKDVQSDADSYVTAASAAHSVPVLVFYNIPHRDCGGYSVGGADDVSVYTDWVRKAATGIGDRHAVVVLEPDALGAVDCLPASLREDRYTSIAKAVTILKANPKTAVYIDA